MKEYTLSFASGKGDIRHNKREINGNPRTYGIRERQGWNVSWNERDAESVIAAKIIGRLKTFNERKAAQRKYKQMKTVDEWIKAKTNGGTRKPYCEFVIQLGNKLTGCTYKHKTDNEGFPVDKHGNRIMPWQTRKAPEPELVNGKVVESEVSKFLKPVYYDILSEFEKENPDMVVVGAYVHADEKGGVHMHIDAVCFAETKNGIGISLSKSGCVTKMLSDKGIRFGNTRKDNAVKVWTKRMRELCTRVALKNGITVVDGHAVGRKHKTTTEYIKDENIRNDYLDDMYTRLQGKEKELRKQEAGLRKAAAGLQKKANELEFLASKFKSKMTAAERREAALDTREGELAYREEIARKMEEANRNKERWLNDKEAEVDALKNRTEALEGRLKRGLRQQDFCDKVINKMGELNPELLREATELAKTELQLERKPGIGRSYTKNKK